MSKVHLFVSSRPMFRGETVAAKCGDVVPKAEILYAWDSMLTNAKMEMPSGLGTCADCVRAMLKKRRKKVEFVYAVAERMDK